MTYFAVKYIFESSLHVFGIASVIPKLLRLVLFKSHIVGLLVVRLSRFSLKGFLEWLNDVGVFLGVVKGSKFGGAVYLIERVFVLGLNTWGSPRLLVDALP